MIIREVGIEYEKKFFKKSLVFGIIIFFVGASGMPSMGNSIVVRHDLQENKTTFKEIDSRGYIQDLIDNASNGDTIYIPSGTYYENIIINKSISLVGEDKNTTIIDGNNVGDVVYISADWVNVSGFTIQNSEEMESDAGIDVFSNHNNITDNIISNNWYSIYLLYSSSNTIIGNNISNNWYGICLYEESNGNNITGNNINSNNRDGIDLEGSSGNNIITNNENGIYLYNSNSNNIIGNNISKNIQGIYIESSTNNTILKNNFIRNLQNAFFINCITYWNQNYWNRPRILPKLIFGTTKKNSKEVLSFNIDWHPAQVPYDITII